MASTEDLNKNEGMQNAGKVSVAVRMCCIEETEDLDLG